MSSHLCLGIQNMTHPQTADSRNNIQVRLLATYALNMKSEIFVHPDAWVLDGADNNLTEIKSNILKILNRPRVLNNQVKSLGCIKLCDETSICHFLKNDVSLWIKFVIQYDKA